ncbi:hypothetical protein DXU04_02370 [Bradyrhizobium diazoefficiens]|nr:hypothetical protein AF336_33935 [Bradyrhizobium diazoefficiens]
MGGVDAMNTSLIRESLENKIAVPPLRNGRKTDNLILHARLRFSLQQNADGDPIAHAFDQSPIGCLLVPLFRILVFLKVGIHPRAISAPLQLFVCVGAL